MKTMYTYFLLMSTLFVISITQAQTTETQSWTEKLKELAQAAYQYIQENPETVDALKKQLLTGQSETQTTKDALTAKLRQKWQESGSDKSFEEWLEEKTEIGS